MEKESKQRFRLTKLERAYHQWCDVDGYKTINHYRQDSGNKEE